MRKINRLLYILGLILFLISVIPLLQITREIVTGWLIEHQYTIHHVYTEEDGFPTHIDVQEITVNDRHIKIVEEQTGKKANLTPFDIDEGVEAGDIVKIHLYVSGKEVTKADEIWLSNRDIGGRYFSWLDILKVNKQIAIIQRLTDDDVELNYSKWKIIWVDEKGDILEEKISYQKRAKHPLAVRLITFSGTSLIPIGYHSDVLTGYPSIFFPLIYPIVTGTAGFILWISAIIYRKKHRY
ncbi:hypothetical protein [Bacillus changyiensis]|uniref:hypothetical protein n=1 Tax=Bacillus changyiensis TaxID=3004103 RepID=UPI0022E21340|nr:hypothetical protein [Bacillus changyiensis]MDA1478003.1 hypothetical protein [Bacillus changyiensis]